MLESEDGLAVTGAAAACSHLAAGSPAVKASGPACWSLQCLQLFWITQQGPTCLNSTHAKRLSSKFNKIHLTHGCRALSGLLVERSFC